MDNKKRSRKREVKCAKEIGGKAHIASGALWHTKGDISNEQYLIEDKFTLADSYLLSLKVLKKLEKEANGVLKIPVLRFGFEETGHNYAVLREQDVFSEYLDKKKILAQSAAVWQKINVIGKHVLVINDELRKYYNNTFDVVRTTFPMEIAFQEDKTYFIFEWDTFVEKLSTIVQ